MILSRVLSLPFLYICNFDGFKVLTITKSSLPFVEFTLNDSCTSHIPSVKLLTMKSFFISLIVVPKIAKYKASAIVDLPTPFLLSSLSRLMPVIICTPLVNSTFTSSSPIDKKFLIFNVLNVTFFIVLICCITLQYNQLLPFY